MGVKKGATWRGWEPRSGSGAYTRASRGSGGSSDPPRRAVSVPTTAKCPRSWPGRARAADVLLEEPRCPREVRGQVFPADHAISLVREEHVLDRDAAPAESLDHLIGFA